MGVKLLSRPIDNSNIAGSIKTEKDKISLFFFSQKTLSTKQVRSSLIASEIVLNLPPFCTVIDILVNGTITQDKLQFVIISLGNESTKAVTNEAGKEKHGHSSASPTLLSNNLCHSLWMAGEGTDTPPSSSQNNLHLHQAGNPSCDDAFQSTATIKLNTPPASFWISHPTGMPPPKPNSPLPVTTTK